jgi:Nucleotidyl transferase AbiEii toxin, Type IV TA system
MNPAIPLLEAAREVEDILSQLGLKAIIIGGIAIFRWGEPRATRDVDFTVLCPSGEESPQITAILDRLRGRIDDADEFAARNRVLLLNASNGRPVDIVLGGLPFEARAVARGSRFEFAPGVALRTCSAEDLVVMKAFAGRDRDLADISGILVRQSAHLDWKLIEEELRPLLEIKDEPGMWPRLLEMKSKQAK